MLIDTNVNLGPWPFTPVADHTGPELADHLAASGIRRALVSHLGAVFQPEPMPTNRKLFSALRSTPALVPVPVIHPALANWREQLAECRAAAPIRAVKIFSNFHNYSLASRRLDPFLDALDEAGLKLLVNVRLEDERHRYFALRIKGVPVAQMSAFLARHPKRHFLFTGIYKPEVEKLAPEHANFSADIAFCELTNTLELMLSKFPARRLMLGTNTPLHSTFAQVGKLTEARIPASAKKLIGSENLRRFLSL